MMIEISATILEKIMNASDYNTLENYLTVENIAKEN